MTYTYNGLKMEKYGKSVIPVSPKPSKEEWETYHEFVRLSKIEQEAYRDR